MTPSMTTRPAAAGDKARIRQLYEAALRHHIEIIWGWDDAWQQAYFDKAFLDLSTRVIEVDGRFAGYLQVDHGNDEDYLSMLVLDAGFRSEGVGARLLAAIQAESGHAGRGIYLRVFRTNAAARRFYEREGWMLVGDEGDFLVMRPGVCVSVA
ncbi:MULTISPECIES: GNAT family N-acetyltransferase [unclassified Massilia]|uniref:GNAT family N-acetyltransferase n=1 Tax=unclassified Massilia TaxID=2609279 RepID=UPI00177B51AF|nr:MULTISPECIES: GNAT family N-acetyltransferase [unclassified Massilia]MBD8532503.1 GNAT family N-acetyltransferase [Massilia sp. CFBP 13647]MBD8675873.1 GNAT family N-acetyltransferase [Massilia sp. CFBP 13721]